MAIETVHLVNHTHTDFGYTDHAASLFRKQNQIIDRAIEVIEANEHRDAGTRFRWTCEVSETTLRWLRQASADKLERFMRLHKAGLMGVAAMPMHWTPLISPELAEHAIDQLDEMRRDFGLTVRTAWQCDVNGLAWYWTDLLLDKGVERLLMAPNPHRGMHDSGAPYLFDWQTPSGKTLPTLYGWHYTYGTNGFQLTDGDLDVSQASFDRIWKRLADHGRFPYKTIPVQLTNPASPDNGFPSAVVPEIVERWNAEGRSPKLVISTVDDAMDALMAEAGEVPTEVGDWPDYWADGVASTAQETVLARAGERLVPATDLLLALSDDPDTEAQSAAVKDIMLYDEHTWGAYSSTTRSQSPFTKYQRSWKTQRAYQGFATSLEALAAAARGRARAVVDGPIENDLEFRRDAPRPISIEGQSYFVFNPTPEPRRVVWPVAHDFAGAAPSSVLHAYLTERFLPGMHVERFGSGQSDTHVIDVELPAFGEAIVKPRPVAPEEMGEVGTNWIANADWRLEVDPANGAIKSLIDRKTGTDHADTSQATGLVSYESLAQPERGRGALFGDGSGIYDWYRLETLVWPSDKTRFQRHVADKVTVEGARPALLGPELTVRLSWQSGDSAVVTYRLPLGQPGVEMTVAVDKAQIEAPDAFYVQFATAGDDAKVQLDIGRAVIDASDEQFEFACRTWASVQAFAGVTTEKSALVVASPDIPLVQPFGIQTEQAGGRTLSDPVLAFQMTNNHWDVNFNAEQPGRITGRYYLFPGAPEAAEAAQTLARTAVSSPVIVRAYDAEPTEPEARIALNSDAPVSVHVRRPHASDNPTIVVANNGNGPAKGTLGIDGRTLVPLSEGTAQADGAFSVPARSVARFCVTS